uniref:Uncharacterized protein n=1 Tax=Rhizophora mucronata TaxID=61149 RepID=A0A2P2NCZ4_RHIMU
MVNLISCHKYANISFLFPWTMSFPATFTREKFNSFPILIT